MAREDRWSIKRAQADAGGDVGVDAADPTQNPQDQVGEDLPPNFATRLGVLAIVNYVKETLTKQANDYGMPAAQFQQALNTSVTKFSLENKLNDALFVAAVSKGSGNPDSIRATTAIFTGLFNNLKDEYNQAQIQEQEPIALQYCEEPTDGSYNGGKGTGQQAWQQIGRLFQTQFQTMVNNFKASQPQQVAPYAAQAPNQASPSQVPSGASASINKSRTIQAQFEQSQQGPLSVGRYESMSQLRDDLVSMGPTPETYEKIMSLVGPEQEDDAKDALGSFFQGLSASLGLLYDMLVSVGMASPIDAETVEKLMSQHPEMNEQQKAATDKPHVHKPSVDQRLEAPMAAKSCDGCPLKHAGLYLPPTDPNAKLEKTAGGSVGGVGTGYNGYTMYGPGDTRMCPKIRQPVSTFICRYHCLDGINVDDHQTVCGEAIWRQSVMDKFSREYRDADGKWTGGYLNKRFETHYDDSITNPALLKPGQRMAPINEDAWSLEKRLAEMRKTESKERGYSETPGDGPKDLYNFDQHELMKGPKNPQLTEKRKDPIARLAASDSMFEKTAMPTEDDIMHENGNYWVLKENFKGREVFKVLRTGGTHSTVVSTFDNIPNALQRAIQNCDERAAQDQTKSMRHGTPGFEEHDWARPEPQEQNPSDFGTMASSNKSFNLAAKKGKGKKKENNPWAICHHSVGPEKSDKFEDCVMDVKKKNHQAENSWGLKKEAWGMDPMMDNVDHGPKAMKCQKCGKIAAIGAKICDNPQCRSNAMMPWTERQITRDTGGIKAPELKLMAGSDDVITLANGIYRVERLGVAAYGDSLDQALEKLAQGGLAKTHPMPIDQEANALLDARQDSIAQPANPMQEMPAPMSNQTQEAPVPAAPQNGMLPQGVIKDETPTTSTVPVQDASPVPVESQGPSEFFPPNVVGPEGWKTPGQEPGPNEGHVGADHLDKQIASAQAGTHPDEHKAIVEQAISSGA